MKQQHAVAFGLLLLAASAFAHEGHDAGKTDAPAQAVSQNEDWTEGEIRKIDRAQGKVTLKHGFIRNLGMDAMTMVFRVKEPRLLVGLEVGQAVRFKATEAGGVLYLLDWQAQP
jgi:Cu/Ag efflux protein CusF